MSPLKPGATIGILGGGQLGRMLSVAAATLGFDVHIFTPDADSPAERVSARAWTAIWDDVDALTAFARTCDVVTYEFENVPVAAVEAIMRTGVPVRPGARSLEKSQDRLVEKRFLNEIGIPTVDFRQVEVASDVVEALAAFGGRAILKRRRDGYDGKGQAVLSQPEDIEAAWDALGDAPCILEAFCPFEREISVVIARGAAETSAWDVSENVHADGVLSRAMSPAQVSAATAAAARRHAETLIDALGHVGVLALEFFVEPGGGLIANEFAPRVHNSGHWTPEACLTGQFEQHIRAVVGWSLGPADRMFDVEMRNVLGEAALALPGSAAANEALTSYGKRDAAPGRKMAHIVRRAPRLDRA